MSEPLWLTGAFVTSLLYSGLIILIVLLYFRLRSRLMLFFLISAAGTLMKLIGEIIRLMPETRLFGCNSLFGCGLLICSGIGLVTYGAPNLLIELTSAKRSKSMRSFITGFALIVAILAGIGIGTSKSRLIVSAYFLEYATGITIGVLAIIKGKSILNPSVRRLSRLIAGLTVTILPLCIAQQIYRLGGNRPLEAAAWPYPQAVLLFLAAAAILWSGFLHLAKTGKVHRETFDIDLLRLFSITPRERDIIIRIAEGDSNDEIASRLFISESTVKNHIYHIYKKTGVHNRVELLKAVMDEQVKESGGLHG